MPSSTKKWEEATEKRRREKEKKEREEKEKEFGGKAKKEEKISEVCILKYFRGEREVTEEIGGREGEREGGREGGSEGFLIFYYFFKISFIKLKARLLGSSVILEYNMRLEERKDKNSKKNKKELLQQKKVEDDQKQKWKDFMEELKNKPLLVETYSTKTIQTH